MDTDRARENCRRDFIWRVRMCNKLCDFGSGRSFNLSFVEGPSAHRYKFRLWALGLRRRSFSEGLRSAASHYKRPVSQCMTLSNNW